MKQCTLVLEVDTIGFRHQQNLTLQGKWASSLMTGIGTQNKGHTRHLVQKTGREVWTTSTLIRIWEQTSQHWDMMSRQLTRGGDLVSKSPQGNANTEKNECALAQGSLKQSKEEVPNPSRARLKTGFCFYRHECGSFSWWIMLQGTRVQFGYNEHLRSVYMNVFYLNHMDPQLS